ncbi:MAG: YlxR family protein [Actinomycetota bacterium]|nr:YlxR family protein [Actinomycetota bacterium]
MCVGCRVTDSWSALLRVVAVGSAEIDQVSVVPDPAHRLPGRGAWLHPSTECFEQAVRRKAFVRALRLQAGPDVRAVADHLESTRMSTVTPPPIEGGSDADEHPMSTQR